MLLEIHGIRCVSWDVFDIVSFQELPPAWRRIFSESTDLWNSACHGCINCIINIINSSADRYLFFTPIVRKNPIQRNAECYFLHLKITIFLLIKIIQDLCKRASFFCLNLSRVSRDQFLISKYERPSIVYMKTKGFYLIKCAFAAFRSASVVMMAVAVVPYVRSNALDQRTCRGRRKRKFLGNPVYQIRLTSNRAIPEMPHLKC